MDKQERIGEIARQVSALSGELKDIRGGSQSSEWRKVRESLASAASFLHKAVREMAALTPMEGQISMFDLLEDGREL